MKTTQWFPGHVKPVRVGVYERLYDEGRELESVIFCRFDGVRWFVCSRIAEYAATQTVESGFQGSMKWRGLTTKDGK